MAQVTEDYVSFETAKLLKEKGFQAKCTACYRSDLNYKFELVSGRINYCNPKFSKCKMIPPYNAPTLQMAMKWLREVHNLSVEVQFFLNEENDTSSWNYDIIDIITYCNKAKYDTCVNFKTHEEACEAAIKYCLENLI